MARYCDNYGEPIYFYNGDPRFHRDCMFYQDPAPISFRTPPFYNDIYYCRSFRDQHPDFSRGEELICIPAREHVRIRWEDPYPYPYPYPYPNSNPYPTPSAPWYDYPHYDGYPVLVVERPHGVHEEDTNLEFYAPQLCSDCRERKVVDALKAFPGVVKVFTDREEKKVVVVGNGLCGKRVLRRLQLVKHMERSVFWRDRRC